MFLTPQIDYNKGTSLTSAAQLADTLCPRETPEITLINYNGKHL